MKILLCSSPCEPFDFLKANGQKLRSAGDESVVPKIAITALMKWMEKNGYPRSDCTFIDFDMLLPSDEEMLEYFRKYAPDVIGISASTSGTYAHIKHIAALVKSVCPETFIVMGGNLSASSNLVLRKTDVDMCVVGDGEIAWVKLLDHIKQHGLSMDNPLLEDIPGLSYLDKNGELIFTGYGEKLSEELMDTIPDYEIFREGLQGQDHLLANYFRVGRTNAWFKDNPKTHEPGRRPMIAMLQANKGCVVKCTFCQRGVKGYRSEPMERLDAHLKEIKEKFDVGFIHVIDENFGSDADRAAQFAELMKEHDLIWVATGVRCTSVTRDRIKHFAENNCVALKFGVESGSQKILDIMEKKFTVQDVKNAIGWCSEFNIFSPLALMFGMPGETLETAKETGRFMAEIALETNISPDNNHDILYLVPFPGTPAYEYGQQIGIIGTSLEEEEYYLLNIFTAPSYKLAYVNMNGAGLSEVLFWDVLAQLEATRHYLKHKEAYKDENLSPLRRQGIPYRDSTIFSEGIFTIVRRKVKARKWRISFIPYVSIFIEKKIAKSVSWARVPRWILYPAVRALLLLEYYAICYVFKKRQKDRESTSLDSRCYEFATVAKAVDRVDDDFRISFPGRRLVSLRTITLKNRKSDGDKTAKNLIKLAGGI